MFEHSVIFRAEAEFSGVVYFDYLVRIPISILAHNRAGAKMQIPGKWRSGVAAFSAEDHRDSYRRDCLTVVVKDCNGEVFEPVVHFDECFAYLEVRFPLCLNGDNFYRLVRPGVPGYNPVRLLTFSTAVS